MLTNIAQHMHMFSADNKPVHSGYGLMIKPLWLQTDQADWLESASLTRLIPLNLQDMFLIILTVPAQFPLIQEVSSYLFILYYYSFDSWQAGSIQQNYLLW